MKTSVEIIGMIEEELINMEKNPNQYSWAEYHVLAKVYARITGTMFESFKRVFSNETN